MLRRSGAPAGVSRFLVSRWATHMQAIPLKVMTYLSIMVREATPAMRQPATTNVRSGTLRQFLKKIIASRMRKTAIGPQTHNARGEARSPASRAIVARSAVPSIDPAEPENFGKAVICRQNGGI